MDINDEPLCLTSRCEKNRHFQVGDIEGNQSVKCYKEFDQLTRWPERLGQPLDVTGL
jgi:hypothetical protein